MTNKKLLMVVLIISILLIGVTATSFGMGYGPWYHEEDFEENFHYRMIEYLETEEVSDELFEEMIEEMTEHREAIGLEYGSGFYGRGHCGSSFIDDRK